MTSSTEEEQARKLPTLPCVSSCPVVIGVMVVVVVTLLMVSAFCPAPSPTLSATALVKEVGWEGSAP